MKKSYIKILVFNLIVFFVLMLNTFIPNLLSNYKMPIFILILIVIFKYLLGFEKDKYRYKKDIIINIIIDIIIFYIAYYLLGILTSFAKNENYITIYGITKFIIPLISTLILKEFLRYGILRKCGLNKKLIIVTTLVFILMDITSPLSILNLKSGYEIMVFFGLTFLPSITKNILLTYISIKEGYKPGIVFQLALSLPLYILPIIPNPNIYLKSIIDLAIPALILVNLINFYKKEKIVNDTDRDYRKHKRSLILIPLLLTVVLVYFVSGYFRYYAIAVASGSMKPVFNRGTVVIVDQRPKNIEKGMIIAFRANNSIIVHRIVNIAEDGDNVYYYTKGDANSTEDKYLLTKKDIIGVVKTKIGFIGYPTVWLSEL